MAVYTVAVFKGTSPPRFVRGIGPFKDEAAAIAEIEHQGLPDAPTDGEWAAVIPEPMPRGGDA